MLNSAGYLALVVMVWAAAAGFVGGVAILLAELAAEFYKEHFRQFR